MSIKTTFLEKMFHVNGGEDFIWMKHCEAITVYLRGGQLTTTEECTSPWAAFLRRLGSRHNKNITAVFCREYNPSFVISTSFVLSERGGYKSVAVSDDAGFGWNYIIELMFKWKYNSIKPYWITFKLPFWPMMPLAPITQSYRTQ